MVGMKASLKLRGGDGLPKKPLLKAKLPLCLLGCPTFAGITVGNREELALRFGTSQEAGPCVEIGYRPNEPDRPFALVMKTGFGPWGSSTTAAVVMAAEFNLSTPSTPSFRLWVKPHIGDFSFRRDFRSICGTAPEASSVGMTPREENMIELQRNVGESDSGFTNSFARYDISRDAHDNDRPHAFTRDIFGDDRDARERICTQRIGGDWEHVGDTVSSSRSSSNSTSWQQVRDGEEMRVQRPSTPNLAPNWGLGALLSDGCFRARSCLPIYAQAHLKIRWRMQGPSSSSNTTFKVPFLPHLVLDKISVEAAGPPLILPETSSSPSFLKPSDNDPKVDQLENMFVSLKETLLSIQLENNFLRKTMESIRVENRNKRTDREVNENPIIDLPAEEAEEKQSPWSEESMYGKRLMD